MYQDTLTCPPVHRTDNVTYRIWAAETAVRSRSQMREGRCRQSHIAADFELRQPTLPDLSQLEPRQNISGDLLLTTEVLCRAGARRRRPDRSLPRPPPSWASFRPARHLHGVRECVDAAHQRPTRLLVEHNLLACRRRVPLTLSRAVARGRLSPRRAPRLRGRSSTPRRSS